MRFFGYDHNSLSSFLGLEATHTGDIAKEDIMSEFAISKVSTGQLNALVKNLMAQMKIDDPNEAVRRVNSEEWVIERIKRLLHKDNVELPSCGSFNPNKFYKTRKGLCIGNDFRNWILLATKPVGSVPAMTLAMFDIDKPANDIEIRDELPKNHVFKDVNLFCAYLAGMIKRQADGEGGILLNNNYFFNIFYVLYSGRFFTVTIKWHCARKEWCLDASIPQKAQYNSGSRVFSSNC